MNPIAIAAKGKGLPGMLRRAETIRQRYGLTPKQMDRTLGHFVTLLGKYKCGATFPITTAILGRSRGVVEKYQAQRIEFAAHGYYHTDQTLLSFDQQLEQSLAARQLFADRGVRCDGFRSPYLRFNPMTLAAIKQAGFVYDSSQALAWDIPKEMETPEYRRALDFYGAVSAAVYPALPRWDNDLIRIPYCLPDDEAFVDRFHTNPARMTELWSSILKSTHVRGELFTVAIHPERILFCQQALSRVLDDARKLQPRVWMTQLYQIADWWKARTQAQVRVTDDASGETTVLVNGLEGVRLFARHVQVTSETRNWDHSFVQAESPFIKFRAARRPFIGVSPSSPAYLSSFLRQQGYIVQVSSEAMNYSFYLDRSHFVYEDERPLLDEIEQGDFPLVRIGRWPNGARSALCVTGDIDALTIWDYALRIF
ncbi:MAG: polysaccharide deacetylase family protein [Chloroflexi bacterium]|nr:polysaccharide deacetylase family protein [Chloroflexota bacterium]